MWNAPGAQLTGTLAMIDKHLRILILDSLHAHVVQIEKLLNRMGYHCIATASSDREGRQLSRAGLRRFDVLLAADNVVRKPGVAGSAFDAYDIANVFIYGRPADSEQVHLPSHGERYWRCGLPEYLVLEWFMARSKRSLPEAAAHPLRTPCTDSPGYFALPGAR